jgi:hypothetical protein
VSKSSSPFGHLKKGALHHQLGYSAGEKIPLAALETASRSSNETLRKRAQFALNARKFKH